MSKPKRLRRKYLIDRRFQLPVAIALSGTGMVMLVYHLVVVHFIVSGARAGALLETRPFITMLPLVFVLMVAFAWLGIHVTHRIVGPAYRLMASMTSYAQGDYSVRSNLRGGDALKDVATKLNALGEALETREKAAKQERAKLRAAIEGGASADELLALLGPSDEEE